MKTIKQNCILSLLFLLFTLPFNVALADRILEPSPNPQEDILAVEAITLGVPSTNYSPLTPSGSSSVYFYVSTEQPNILLSDFTSAKRSLWSGKAGYSKVTALVTDELGGQYEAVLRVQKKLFSNRWIKMNDGVQRGHGSVRVKFNIQDNDKLPAGIYHSEFMITGVDWHDGGKYKVSIKSVVKFEVFEHPIQGEFYPYQKANGGILPIEELSLGKTSVNYAKRTPSGTSSVYFYVPTTQPNVVRSDFTQAKRSLWNGRPGYSKVTALLKDKYGEQHKVVLRVQKKTVYGRWVKMNDGVQRGFGAVKVSFLPKDNPADLRAGTYQGDFIIIGAGWHDKGDYRVAIKSVVKFTLNKNVIK
ncbi:MAG: hypothetical protein FE834_08585 [Gammaproteobacteria bacterium]|nr:hypothetical protein [Gammaproteobacteria bacterium]